MATRAVLALLVLLAGHGAGLSCLQLTDITITSETQYNELSALACTSLNAKLTLQPPDGVASTWQFPDLVSVQGLRVAVAGTTAGTTKLDAAFPQLQTVTRNVSLEATGFGTLQSLAAPKLQSVGNYLVVSARNSGAIKNVSLAQPNATVGLSVVDNIEVTTLNSATVSLLQLQALVACKQLQLQPVGYVVLRKKKKKEEERKKGRKKDDRKKNE